MEKIKNNAEYIHFCSCVKLIWKNNENHGKLVAKLEL